MGNHHGAVRHGGVPADGVEVGGQGQVEREEEPRNPGRDRGARPKDEVLLERAESRRVHDVDLEPFVRVGVPGPIPVLNARDGAPDSGRGRGAGGILPPDRGGQLPGHRLAGGDLRANRRRRRGREEDGEARGRGLRKGERRGPREHGRAGRGWARGDGPRVRRGRGILRGRRGLGGGTCGPRGDPDPVEPAQPLGARGARRGVVPRRLRDRPREEEERDPAPRPHPPPFAAHPSNPSESGHVGRMRAWSI